MLSVISTDELRRISESIKEGLNELEVSLDLGLSKKKIRLEEKGFFVDNNLIEIPKIRIGDKSCYLIKGKKLRKVQFFSQEIYKLIPTKHRPILQISGTSMHKKEFVERINKDKLKGIVLDSGTGLGYSAITASKTADSVITIENDENVIKIARLNPYSMGLFENKNIRLIMGNLTEEIKKFKDSEFNFIILDFGNKKSFGEVFSLENYKEAYRILRNNGKLYNYLPKHQIKRGRDFISEVSRRIKEAGFSKIEKNSYDSYVVAGK